MRVWLDKLTVKVEPLAPVPATLQVCGWPSMTGAEIVTMPALLPTLTNLTSFGSMPFARALASKVLRVSVNLTPRLVDSSWRSKKSRHCKR